MAGRLMRRVRALALATVLLAAAAPPVAGQSRPTTIGDVIDAAAAASAIARWSDEDPAAQERLARVLRRLERHDLAGLRVASVAAAVETAEARPEAPWTVVARWRPRALAHGLTRAEVENLDSLVMVMAQDLVPALERRVGERAADSIMAALDSLTFAQRGQSLVGSLEKLRRYERRFGPDSPRPNGVELLLNYGAQRLPGFRPDARGWPSPVELVAAYVPTYLTFASGGPAALPVTEVGVRWYIYTPGWGEGEGGGMLRPGHVSVGAAFGTDEAGVPGWPWRGRVAPGAFLGWGPVKAAYLHGDAPRIVFTRQLQVVPFLF